MNETGWFAEMWVDLETVIHSKSEREKQILYINAYMWTWKKWYRQSYLQKRKRGTDVENKHGHQGEGWGWNELGDQDWQMHITDTVYETEKNENLLYSTGSSARCSVVTYMGKKYKNEGIWQTQIRSLSKKDPLEQEMAIHSNILARKIPWTEEPGGLQSMGVTKESDTI